jgi:hypothetical protein
LLKRYGLQDELVAGDAIGIDDFVFKKRKKRKKEIHCRCYKIILTSVLEYDMFYAKQKCG